MESRGDKEGWLHFENLVIAPENLLQTDLRRSTRSDRENSMTRGSKYVEVDEGSHGHEEVDDSTNRLADDVSASYAATNPLYLYILLKIDRCKITKTLVELRLLRSIGQSFFICKMTKGSM